jgi:hypothetical protein
LTPNQSVHLQIPTSLHLPLPFPIALYVMHTEKCKNLAKYIQLHGVLGRNVSFKLFWSSI